MTRQNCVECGAPAFSDRNVCEDCEGEHHEREIERYSKMPAVQAKCDEQMIIGLAKFLWNDAVMQGQMVEAYEQHEKTWLNLAKHALKSAREASAARQPSVSNPDGLKTATKKGEVE